MSGLKFVGNFLLCLLLMLLLTCTGLAFVTSSTLLNSDYYARSLAKVNYYEQLKVETEKDFVDLGLATGLPKEVFENSIDKSWLQTEGNSYIASLIGYFTGRSNKINYELRSEPLKNQLQGNISNYAKKVGVSLTPESRKSIDALIERGVSIAKNQLIIVDTKNLPLQSVRRIASALYASRFPLIIADLVLLGLMFLLNKQRVKNFFQWFAYCLLATGLFLLIPSLLISFSSILNRLALSNVFLKEAITTILSGYFMDVLFAGLISLLAGAAILVITQREYRRS